MGSKRSEKPGMTRLLPMAEVVYYATPVRLRFIFWPARLAFGVAQVLRVNQWIMAGREITSEQELAIVYCGSEKNKSLFTRLAFDGFCRETYVGRMWLWKALQMVKRRSCECSLMVIEMPRALRVIFRRKRCFYIPSWIHGEVDVSRDISLLVNNKSLKSDVSKIARNKLRFEVTNELPQFQHFCYDMHLPYCTKVYGDEAVTMRYTRMKHEFRNLALLLTGKEGEYVAGMLLNYAKRPVRLWCLGVKDGNSDHVKEGAIGALFYFSLRYLQEKGYKSVDFGASRAFLRDGVLKYKKKWHPRICHKNETGFLVRPISRTAGVRGFLVNNPFIYLDRGRLNGAVFIESDQSLSREDVEKIYRKCYLEGMARLVIHRFGETDRTVACSIPPELSDRITIRSAESVFPVHADD